MSFEVVITGKGKIVHLEGEASLREELLAKGIEEVRGNCGGHANCTNCRIIVESGEQNLSEQTLPEKNLLGNVFYLTRERLSCQCRVQGDVTLTIPAQKKSQSNRPIIKVRPGRVRSVRTNESSFEGQGTLREGGTRRLRKKK